MTPKKMREVIGSYRSLLSLISPSEGPYEGSPSPREALAHVHGMLERVERQLDSYESEAGYDSDWEKSNRWLGFIQGVLWLHGDYTLDQLKEHNRTERPPPQVATSSLENLIEE
jgi:hypothetical protein